MAAARRAWNPSNTGKITYLAHRLRGREAALTRLDIEYWLKGEAIWQERYYQAAQVAHHSPPHLYADSRSLASYPQKFTAPKSSTPKI